MFKIKRNSAGLHPKPSV